MFTGTLAADDLVKKAVSPLGDAGPNERIGILPRNKRNKDSIDHECNKKHCRNEYDKDMNIVQQVAEASVLGAGAEHETHYAERSEPDDYPHNAADAVRKILQHDFGLMPCSAEHYPARTLQKRMEM